MLSASRFVSVTEAKKFIPLTARTIQRMCEHGVFKSAHKPGFRIDKKSIDGKKERDSRRWRILEDELRLHQIDGHTWSKARLVKLATLTSKK